jgi:hypothetical protein
VFNQFKHFLALSLLITFSFNAFSVADPQQFNKEAYLDHSKPYTYNWINAQPTTKQDSWLWYIKFTMIIPLPPSYSSFS